MTFPAYVGCPLSDAEYVAFIVKHAFFYRDEASNEMRGWCISLHPQSWEDWSFRLKKECSFEPYTQKIASDDRYVQNARSLHNFASAYKPKTIMSSRKQALPTSVLSYASERLWHSKQDVHAVINIWTQTSGEKASQDLVLLKVVNYPLFLTVLVGLSAVAVSRHLSDLTAFINREVHTKYQKHATGVEALSKGLYVRSAPLPVIVWTRTPVVS